MTAFYHLDQAEHDPRQFMLYGRICEATDVPERTKKFAESSRASWNLAGAAPDYGREAVEAVHSARYLDYLETAYARWIQLPKTRAGGASEHFSLLEQQSHIRDRLHA